MKKKDLTTTSYAILGLLGIRPHSAYDLAKQMARSLHYIWPRAESAIYEEPKNLVAHGLAKAAKEPAGKRTRTVYAITPAGRRTLAAWLATPPAPPLLEIEPVVRVMFGEQGTKEDLIRSIGTLGDWARQIQDLFVAIGRQYAGDDPPYPHRAHVASLAGTFMHEYAAMLERWAMWATEEVERWPSTGEDVAPRGGEIARRLVASYGRLESERPERLPEHTH